MGQIVSTNICESTGRSQKLSEFQRGTVIVVIIIKWKHLAMTVTRPQSGRPHKNHRAGSVDAEVCSAQRLPTFCRVNRYRSANFTTFRLAREQCIESFTECVSMVEQLHPNLTSPSTIQTFRCSGV